MTAPALPRYGARALPVFWSLAGQVLTGGPDEFGCMWSVKSARGWRGTSNPRTRLTERGSASGSTWGAAYRDARVITLSDCHVRCPSPAVRADTEERLAQLLPDRDDVDLWPLVRIGENGVAQVRYVGLDDAIDPIPVGRYWIDYDVQLIAPDPRKFSLDWQTAEAGAPSGGIGGIDATGSGIVSTGLGIAAGTSGAPSYSTVTGGGSADNPTVIEVAGGAVDVIVADLLGSGRVRYRGQVPPGMSAFINCDSQPAYGVPGAAGPIPGRGALLGTSDARSAVVVTGGWPTVPAGASRSFAVVAGSMDSDARLRVHVRSCWD